MSDEEALLAAIAAQPDEDTPRLAYADWLDEYANDLPDPDLARVRAEFIRVQVERLRCPYWLPGYVARYNELCGRAQEIERHYRAAILGDAANIGAIDVSFTRGFPCLSMPSWAFLTNAERFKQLRPPILKVTDAVEHWSELLAHTHFPLVTDLVLTADWAIDPATLRELGELGPRNRIRGLHLAHCYMGPPGLSALAKHADVWHLDDLDLSHNSIDSSRLPELLATPIPATLRRVNLCGNSIHFSGAQLLAERWPKHSPLKWLRLEGNPITPDGRELLRDRFGEKVEFGPRE